MRLGAFTLSAFLALGPVTLVAQGWNDSSAMVLVRRAVERRAVVQGDSGLRSWHVRAHGVLLFLAQLGEEGTGTSRLVKADELDVEVYWSAPGTSKQRILGWRDRRYLPTDIQYHRDHLGIVTDGYGPRIRLGNGDEVRDVVHPLSPEGLGLYDYLLRDSVEVAAGGERVGLAIVDVRPKDPRMPGVIGSVYLDRSSAELVRARFSFTPVSYRDNTVEDLTILLDYALVDHRVWLPFRQTIEIRRNAGWLDLPYTGVIRATWDFGDYDLDLVVPPAALVGPAIGGLRTPGDSVRPWPAPFDTVLAQAGPVVSERDVAEARVEVARAVEGHLSSGLAPARVAARSISDLAHYDRVEGVALGVGTRIVGSASRVEWEQRLGVATATGRLTGGTTLRFRTPGSRPATFDLYAERTIRDFADQPVMSGVLNSLTAQESGDDHGDYLMVEGVGGRFRTHAKKLDLGVRLGWEDPSALPIAATPARGTFRVQPDLGTRGYWTGEVGLGVREEDDDHWSLVASGGAGRTTWSRLTFDLQGTRYLGGTALRVKYFDGLTNGAAPAWRTFALGGRGTLLGDRFRAWGGARMTLASLEWRIPVPLPAIPLGDFATTGHEGILAPFIAVGRAEEGVPGMPWTPTNGVRGSAGAALELFYRLVRVEAGWSLESGHFGMTFDVGRAWWGVL